MSSRETAKARTGAGAAKARTGEGAERGGEEDKYEGTTSRWGGEGTCACESTRGGSEKRTRGGARREVWGRGDEHSRRRERKERVGGGSG